MRNDSRPESPIDCIRREPRRGPKVRAVPGAPLGRQTDSGRLDINQLIAICQLVVVVRINNNNQLFVLFSFSSFTRRAGNGYFGRLAFRMIEGRQIGASILAVVLLSRRSPGCLAGCLNSNCCLVEMTGRGAVAGVAVVGQLKLESNSYARVAWPKN